MAIKIAESALKRRVGRVSGNTGIFLGLIQLKSILHRNEELPQCFRNKTFLKSKRQPPNLKRLLTKAKFTRKQTEEYSVKQCNEPRCGLCKYICEGLSVEFKNKTFKVNENMSCKAKNVIYVIQCGGCDEQYIGEANNLWNKTTLNNQHIRHEALRKIPLSGHIAYCSHKEPNYFINFPFYQMKTESIIKRNEKETFFIRTFLPKLNAV